ncbi:MAG: polyprenyl synthetase family protein [Flavobacteriales bacterium]
MKTLATYSELIEIALRDFNLPKQPSNLYDPLHYFLKLGGKRMRPILTLLAAEAFGKTAKDGLQAALAVELFHNFSLIHDDIMDAAPLRRGQQTIHEKWNTNIAILSGDVLLVKAYECLANYEPTDFKKLFTVFNQTAVEVCEGQQYDMDFEQLNDVTEAAYIEMIRLKTSVLLGCALEFGAIIGGADQVAAQQIYRFGEQLGLAFQIQDDLLDLYGTEAQVGKQIGGDVLANKKTLLSIAAKSLATPAQQLELAQIAALPDAAEKIARTQRIYQDLGAKSFCETKMNAFHKEALTALDQLESQHSKTAFYDLAEFLLNRAH